MKKTIDFFRSASPLKIVLFTLPITCISEFIEKPFPNIFLGVRLIAFMLIIYAVVKYFSEK